LAKKKCRKRSFASAEATNAPRVGSAPPFEKGGRKLPRRHRREVTDKSKFEISMQTKNQVREDLIFLLFVI
jgi:hypothetical protein